MRPYDPFCLYVPSQHSHDLLRAREKESIENEDSGMEGFHSGSILVCFGRGVRISHVLQQTRRATKIKHLVSTLWK